MQIFVKTLTGKTITLTSSVLFIHGVARHYTNYYKVSTDGMLGTVPVLRRWSGADGNPGEPPMQQFVGVKLFDYLNPSVYMIGLYDRYYFYLKTLLGCIDRVIRRLSPD
ncbi:hypothetical protein Tsubulata_046076 [Turnera subulata]|uniref:Uncharacterized protein n=1 Tax=Turnera subulata TaxID=218843 RepID=A0A9Q0F149_9ROSI|nr:hypothetical protein Tsubulata_046076 [Turnera subulata]